MPFASIACGKANWVRGPARVLPAEGKRPGEPIRPTAKYSQEMTMNAHLAAEYDLLLNIAEAVPWLCDSRSAAKVPELLQGAHHSARRGGELYKLE